MPSYASSRLLFRASRSAYEEVANLYNFVWPSVVGLWHLRWQVSGFSRLNLPEKDLHSQFVVGTGLRGVNLKTACVDTSWDDQQHQFSKFLLVDLFAIYEGWLEAVLTSIKFKSLLKNMQFPTEVSSSDQSSGLGYAIARIQADPSEAILHELYPELVAHKKNSKASIESLMICYRMFKETRNSLMHRGGIADKKAADAYTPFKHLSAQDLGLREKPLTHAIIDGSMVKLELRGVVGFSDVILRLIASLDAELSVSKNAEPEFRTQWVAAHGRRKMLPSVQPRRSEVARKLVSGLGLPKPIASLYFEQLLTHHRLVSSA